MICRRLQRVLITVLKFKGTKLLSTPQSSTVLRNAAASKIYVARLSGREWTWVETLIGRNLNFRKGRYNHSLWHFWLRSKCSICSYQFHIWYVPYPRTSILNWFLDLGEDAGACSGISTLLSTHDWRPNSSSCPIPIQLVRHDTSATTTGSPTLSPRLDLPEFWSVYRNEKRSLAIAD